MVVNRNEKDILIFLDWFKSKDFSEISKIQINNHTTINDIDRFVSCHSSYVMKNWKKYRLCKPYVDRLKILREKLIDNYGFK